MASAFALLTAVLAGCSSGSNDDDSPSAAGEAPAAAPSLTVDGQPRQLTDAVDCVTSVPGEVWAMVGYTDDGNPSTVETDGVSVRFTDGDPPKLEKILLPKKDDYSPQYYNSDPGEQPAVTRSDATYTVKGTTTPVIPGRPDTAKKFELTFTCPPS